MNNSSLLYSHAIHQDYVRSRIIEMRLPHVEGGEKSGAAETGVLKDKGEDHRQQIVPSPGGSNHLHADL